MTREQQPARQSAGDLDAEEQWILDLLAGENDSRMHPKYILGTWETEFSDSDFSRLRSAVASLRDKGWVEVLEDGSLSLTRQKSPL